jgi:hypothetical protein
MKFQAATKYSPLDGTSRRVSLSGMFVPFLENQILTVFPEPPPPV